MCNPFHRDTLWEISALTPIQFNQINSVRNKNKRAALVNWVTFTQTI